MKNYSFILGIVVGVIVSSILIIGCGSNATGGGSSTSSASSSYGLLATGQTTTNEPYLSDCVTDYPTAGSKEGCDAWYHKGLKLSYTDNNGNGTITDNNTGLMWVKDPSSIEGWGIPGSPSQMTWTDAIASCEALDYAGHTDWRLPNIKELQSIVDYSRTIPCIDPVFTNAQSSNYWSSTTSATFTGNAWSVGFYDGGVYGNGKTSTNYVRPVRGGQ